MEITACEQMPKFRKVMIIDDTEVDRYITTYMLKKFHFSHEIIIMESARKAINYLMMYATEPEQLPEFIFLDIRMPEIDGFGFLVRYESIPECVKKACTIIMLSSSLHPIDLERAAQNKHIKKFVNKPLDRFKLEEIYTAQLSLR
jgi:CheY-like chemotaxis protein